MTNGASGTQGIAGDRRRNPFPSMNDTEYELLLMTVERCVERGVAKAMGEYRETNCSPHQRDTQKIKTVVFGSAEAGLSGLDERVSALEHAMQTLSRVTWVAVSALIVGFIGLLIGLVQFAILGK